MTRSSPAARTSPTKEHTAMSINPTILDVTTELEFARRIISAPNMSDQQVDCKGIITAGGGPGADGWAEVTVRDLDMAEAAVLSMGTDQLRQLASHLILVANIVERQAEPAAIFHGDHYVEDGLDRARRRIAEADAAKGGEAA